MSDYIETALHRPNFIAFVVLFLWGFFIMVAHPNLVKKLIGMYLLQTSVLFLLVTLSAKGRGHSTDLAGKRCNSIRNTPDRPHELRQSTTTCFDINRDCCPSSHLGRRPGSSRRNLPTIWQFGRG